MYLANRLLDVDDVDDDNIAFVVDDVDGDDDGGYGNYGRINFMLFSLRVTLFFCHCNTTYSMSFSRYNQPKQK